MVCIFDVEIKRSKKKLNRNYWLGQGIAMEEAISILRKHMLKATRTAVSTNKASFTAKEWNDYLEKRKAGKLQTRKTEKR